MTAAPLAGVVGLPDVDLIRLIAGLSRSHFTVSCAESLTGGLLTALLTETPGASAVVRGGLVVYATELKHLLAGVDSRLLSERGPVDPDVAVALAAGVRTACGSSVGLGLTGVAGPDPQDGVAVGTWYVALSWNRTHRLVSHIAPAADGAAEPADRAAIRTAAVRAAVGLLQELVPAS
jgi:nicotinamide-nucleotide amidase